MSNSKKPIEPEVLPAKDELAQRVVNLHVMAGQCARMSVYCAAAAGATALMKKKTLKHGQFTPWLRTLVLADGREIGERTAFRYMALAKEMAARILALPKSTRVGFFKALPTVPKLTRVSVLDASHPVIEILASFNPANINSLRDMAAAQMIRKVTSEESLRQLYFGWGIIKDPPRLGGHHPRKGPAPSAEDVVEHETKMARDEWNRFKETIAILGLEEKTWGVLPTPEIEGLISYVEDFLSALHSTVRERKPCRKGKR